ncbi:MAG: DNA adenine methylase [Candidatus Obscuribacterales bacterium]|nr:DNA adenine methylase [Candidatus Obscuribacterales bacterium]
MQEPTKFRSPLRYPGGKQKAISKIAKMLPKKIGEYREPMVGGGSVYLHAKANHLADSYWINDKFKELVSFWRIGQDKKLCKKLVADLSKLHGSFRSGAQIKKYFQKARLEQPRDRYRQALLFFFFNRVTFSGTTRAGGFSSQASLDRFTESSIMRLIGLPEALAGTKITNVDFEDVITKPGKDVFLFLDPPYYLSSNLYGRNGSLHEFDHERLAKLLKDSRHRFLITYDDCPEVRRLYSKWAKIKSWKLQYGMNNCNQENLSKVGRELFIYNY